MLPPALMAAWPAIQTGLAILLVLGLQAGGLYLYRLGGQHCEDAHIAAKNEALVKAADETANADMDFADTKDTRDTREAKTNEVIRYIYRTSPAAAVDNDRCGLSALGLQLVQAGDAAEALRAANSAGGEPRDLLPPPSPDTPLEGLDGRGNGAALEGAQAGHSGM